MLRKGLVLACSIFVGMGSSALAGGSFDGELGFSPKGCETTRKCFLTEHFRYKDSKKGEWEARKGDETDGASIPSWAQSFIGLPFDPSFIKAAVIHDHYCKRQVRNMFETHWVFYDALISSGVTERKAKIMYAAIMIGGPKWIFVKQGEPCSKGANCVQSLATLNLPAGAARSVADNGKPIIAREANFDDAAVKAAIEAARVKIEANPDAVSLTDIDKMAETVPENSFFFRNADGIVIPPSKGIYE